MMDEHKRQDGHKDNAMPDIWLSSLEVVVQHSLSLYYGENFHDQDRKTRSPEEDDAKFR